jgi:hypothetical protein
MFIGSTNIRYIPFLTDKETEKYNADEYMPLYHPRLHVTEEYTGPPPPRCARAPDTCPYIPRLTKEYRVIRS